MAYPKHGVSDIARWKFNLNLCGALAWRHGGLGLRSARADRHTAHWASWCDTLPVIHARAPEVARWLLSALDGQQPLPSAAAAAQSLQRVRANRYDAPAGASVLRPDSAPPARVRASLKLPFGVGSASPERTMSARARHTLLTCRLRLVRCCSRSRGCVLPGPSPPCRPMGPSSSPVPTSASSCSAACACRCRLPRAPADAVAMRRHGTMVPPPRLTKIVAPSRMQRQSRNQTQRRQRW